MEISQGELPSHTYAHNMETLKNIPQDPLKDCLLLIL